MHEDVLIVHITMLDNHPEIILAWNQVVYHSATLYVMDRITPVLIFNRAADCSIHFIQQQISVCDRLDTYATDEQSTSQRYLHLLTLLDQWRRAGPKI
jgi:hypothetical protein